MKTRLLTSLLFKRAGTEDFFLSSAPLDVMGDVKLLSVQGYSIRQEFFSMWSKIETSCHHASDKV